ncbi:composite domain of metallo-dependent hydrolase [Calocera viscosa TUFC12733]|uniref:Composite domain of metallo-dependent hydrolase n=1 Tax=Calocera viscosa (strain TUFC12733) TaxID=1330018 RepID=A0A167IYE5_CALVF|nr:composite domain of metallo-dependent hydrolase [Calocera viscosa TUFC12733]
MSFKLEDDVLPAYIYAPPLPPPRRRPRMVRLLVLALASYTLVRLWGLHLPWCHAPISRPANADKILAQCRALPVLPGPPAGFAERTESDRFEPDTPPTLIVNGTIWLGGERVVEGELYMDGGVIRAIGYVPKELYENEPGVVVVNAQGAWVTPGIVDLHSHLGVDSLPGLEGAADGNSLLGPVQPWLRSLDGLNTRDTAYTTSIAGGVTSALVLPGSANNIGGQAFMIKLRPTTERSSSAMVLEPPYGLWNGTDVDPEERLRWRHIKHACGENPARVYGQTRMDNVYRFRQAYTAAAALRDAQDAYCASALTGDWKQLVNQVFPYDLALEALVDVLRGKVKVNVHCYEAVDFDGFVRITNEFKFPVAAFHHAHEAYLVPDLLKKTWGGAPAIAMFATFARYKREAYRGSEFAPKILADEGIRVVMKSDHPMPENSRHLMFDAQQAYFYGLNASLALESVTSTPADAAGFAHRLGQLKVGHDADVVVWDSHPLQLGATPLQVYVDGIAQLSYAPKNVIDNGRTYLFLKEKQVEELQVVPPVADYEAEAREVLEYDGEPPLGPKEVHEGGVLFKNVQSIWQRDTSNELSEQTLGGKEPLSTGEVLVKNGNVICTGSCAHLAFSARVVDLRNGSIAPGLTTFGSAMGLAEIKFESSTADGYAYDLFSNNAPVILNGKALRAVDGIQFGGRDMLIAYRSGVTTAITAPARLEFEMLGLSGAFRTGAWNKAEKGSVIKPVTAMVIAIRHRDIQPSISAQVAGLRQLLSTSKEDEMWWDLAHGTLPLVISVESADIMSTLILLKQEIEAQFSSSMRLTFAGASEAWMLAKNIADADIGVIIAPSRPTPLEWEQKRTLPGVPLTDDSNISLLLAHNVTVGIGVVWEWQARNTRFDAIWAYREARGKITKRQALELASSSVNKLLGLGDPKLQVDLVAYQGGDFFSPGAKVVGILSADKGVTELL